MSTPGHADTPSLPGDHPDAILSIEDGPEIELVEKGSRFLGQAFAADDDATCRERLTELRERYPGASHHCWASRVGPPEDVTERADDDGEPSGTAGQPILGALLRDGIHGAMLIVTRFFGGTKLGRGGLVRAYGEAAREALAVAPRRTIWRLVTLAIECDYSDVGAVETVLVRGGENVANVIREFTARPRLIVTVRAGASDAVVQGVVDATAGRAVVERGC